MADDPCKKYLPVQDKWSHAEKEKLSKLAGNANKAFFDAVYAHINGLARDLALPDARFLYALAAHESGWLNKENTWLNNPFGMTMGGKDNLGFDNIAQACDYWECKFGQHVKGKKTMDQFVAGLKLAKYNPNEAYYAPAKWEAQLRSIDKWSAKFGYKQEKQDGVNMIVPK